MKCERERPGRKTRQQHSAFSIFSRVKGRPPQLKSLPHSCIRRGPYAVNKRYCIQLHGASLSRIFMTYYMTSFPSHDYGLIFFLHHFNNLTLMFVQLCYALYFISEIGINSLCLVILIRPKTLNISLILYITNIKKYDHLRMIRVILLMMF